jgi:hypothetical protein
VSRFVETYTIWSQTMEAFQCGACGALVGDRARHDIFHRALRLTSGFNSGYTRSAEWLRIRDAKAALRENDQ